MAIQIGAPLASDFSNPLGVLSDCHRRVEYFLRLLVIVTEQAHGEPLNAEQRDALEVALRYFAEAAPKHTADEEESLFPLLRASPHAEATEAVALAIALSRDHDKAATQHAAVDALARRWLADGCLKAAPARALAAHLSDLTTMYRHHIAVEDDELLPLARRVLSPTAIVTLGCQMARRRGLDPARVGVGPVLLLETATRSVEHTDGARR
jgi:hemerythrin-like domain-containing protein